MTTLFNRRPRSGLALLGALALIGSAAACGENAWSDLPTGGSNTVQDGSKPNIRIEQPEPLVQLGIRDSILVSVRLSDDVGIDSLSLVGFSLRGSAQLGTDTRVERFARKLVDLTQSTQPVRDTVITRYLVPIGESLPESPVYLEVRARDAEGNSSADTVKVTIGGPVAPSVLILKPRPAARVEVDDSVLVQFELSDDAGIDSVVISGFSLRGSVDLGTLTRVDRYISKRVDLTRADESVRDTVISRYLLPTSEGLDEEGVHLSVAVYDDGGNTAADTVQITIGGPEAPAVNIVQPETASRVAVQDSVLVRFRLADDGRLDSVRISGFSLRGSAALGTQTRVERFASKVVDLTDSHGVVGDTLISRYLLPTTESLPENPVFVEVAARDAAGQVTADTVQISIGGPRVQILSPVSGGEVRAGTSLKIRLSASDSISSLQAVGVRLSGAVMRDTMLRLDPPAARTDTIVLVSIPSGAAGPLEVSAIARSLNNDSTVSAPVAMQVGPAARDDSPPIVQFSVKAGVRKEIDDTLTVTVLASDSTRLGRVGVIVRPSLRFSAFTQPLPRFQRERATADSAIFRFTPAELGAEMPSDEAYVLRLEVSAFAVDTAGNCATATVQGTPLSQACSPESPAAGEEVASNRPGSRVDVVVVRGATTRVDVPSDRLVDLVADSAGRRVFVSNLSRNRVEVLPFGAESFRTPISVGSAPWGLAISRSRDTMFVANSGGTNISVVPLTGGALRETWRIHTSNVRLYSFDYDLDSDSVSAMSEHDYSDRPQFLGQVKSGQLLYSTKPTAASSDGTIRIFDAAKDTTSAYNRGSEILVQYARDAKSEGKGVVVNALEVDVGNGMLIILPRKLQSGDTALTPIVATPTAAAAALKSLRDANQTDTRVDLYVDVADIGLTDTTFVAVSRDHGAIAFGEGAANPGRIFRFQSKAGSLDGMRVDTDDLVGNAADRVVGLSLNRDGTLGVARGSQSYFFNQDLRLQGVVDNGQPGGVALHPLNADYPDASTPRVAFVSGVDGEGRPYVDVVDSYTFRSLSRIPIREPITGSMTAVAVGSDDPESGRYALRLFGITAGGVVEIGITEEDLR